MLTVCSLWSPRKVSSWFHQNLDKDERRLVRAIAKKVYEAELTRLMAAHTNKELTSADLIRDARES